MRNTRKSKPMNKRKLFKRFGSLLYMIIERMEVIKERSIAKMEEIMWLIGKKCCFIYAVFTSVERKIRVKGFIIEEKPRRDNKGNI